MVAGLLTCERCGTLTQRTCNAQKWCSACAAESYKIRAKRYHERRRRLESARKAMRRREIYGGYFALPRRSLCCDCATIFITGRGGGTRCPVCRDWRKTDESKHERRSNAATKLTEEERATSRDRHRAYVREYKKTDEYKIKKRAEQRQRIQTNRSRMIITCLERIKGAINVAAEI